MMPADVHHLRIGYLSSPLPSPELMIRSLHDLPLVEDEGDYLLHIFMMTNPRLVRHRKYRLRAKIVPGKHLLFVPFQVLG